MLDSQYLRPTAVTSDATAATPLLAVRDDDELMQLAAAGHNDAFAVLVGRYLVRLTSFCAKLVGDIRSGEEIVQDTWLQIWAARSAYQPRNRFAVYLYTIARNRARNHRRDRWRRAQLDPALGMGDIDVTPVPLDTLVERERRRQVNSAILRLPPASREVLLLRFGEGLGYPDIARIVGRAEAAVRARVHVALQRLRAEVGGET